ncbi:hypothetical protein J421_1540 [Gemmatirosa kalamazoonensis]|uniref:Uncharacterized protein n=1 Tax=Gemmatirosa kalamazoonensis TaxID=861299 RepID=W0RF55_9BACT|nr:hypothetical protein J421_1540 [Gemmatirosa kalamazoonensis]
MPQKARRVSRYNLRDLRTTGDVEHAENTIEPQRTRRAAEDCLVLLFLY